MSEAEGAKPALKKLRVSEGEEIVPGQHEKWFSAESCV
jgi:hypothetical protein